MAEMDVVTHHCLGPLDSTVDDARDLVYSCVSTLPSFLKDRYPTLSDDLCKRVIKNVVAVFLEELEKEI